MRRWPSTALPGLPVGWRSLRIPTHCMGAPSPTRWCRPWRVPSSFAAGRPCGSTSVVWVRAGVSTTKGAGSCRTCWRLSAHRCLTVRCVLPASRLVASSQAGFSFGGFVASQAVAALHGQRDIQKVVLVGPATSRFGVAAIPDELRQRTLVIHGEHDDTVPLQSVMDWARPQALPVLVVPGGGHFFHGQLPLVRELVQRHLVA